MSDRLCKAGCLLPKRPITVMIGRDKTVFCRFAHLKLWVDQKEQEEWRQRRQSIKK